MAVLTGLVELAVVSLPPIGMGTSNGPISALDRRRRPLWTVMPGPRPRLANARTAALSADPRRGPDSEVEVAAVDGHPDGSGGGCTDAGEQPVVDRYQLHVDGVVQFAQLPGRCQVQP